MADIDWGLAHHIRDSADTMRRAAETIDEASRRLEHLFAPGYGGSALQLIEMFAPGYGGPGLQLIDLLEAQVNASKSPPFRKVKRKCHGK